MRGNFNSAHNQTLSARVIARLSAFAGRASLAAAVAIAALTLPLAPANAALGKEQGAANASLDFNKKDGAPSLYIAWSGPIAAGMADYLRTEMASDIYIRSSNRSDPPKETKNDTGEIPDYRRDRCDGRLHSSPATREEASRARTRPSR